MKLNALSAKAHKNLKVFIIEDSPLLRDMLLETLQDIGGVEVVGQAADEVTALQGLAEASADLAVVDIELRGGSGLGVLQALKREPQRYHAVRAVVLTNHSHASVRKRCDSLGCLHFFDKSMQIDDLVGFIQHEARQAAARSDGSGGRV